MVRSMTPATWIATVNAAAAVVSATAAVVAAWAAVRTVQKQDRPDTPADMSECFALAV
jgi:hypothetical protein